MQKISPCLWFDDKAEEVSKKGDFVCQKPNSYSLLIHFSDYVMTSQQVLLRLLKEIKTKVRQSKSE